MEIRKIRIKNFRLLKDFKLDLENNLSLIIGKNNTGKTSLLSVLEKFLTDKSTFSINDFHIDQIKKLEKLEKRNVINIGNDFDFKIQLFFEIFYDKEDSLKNISSLILNLEDENKVILGFEYYLNPDSYSNLIREYGLYKSENTKKNITDFLRKTDNKRFFKMEIKSFIFDGDEVISSQVIKDKNIISKIINFQSIKAKRDVNNSDSNRPDKTLSKLSSDYYESIENSQQEQETINRLNKELGSTDEKLNKIYPSVFKDVIKKVELFGGKMPGESSIKILSSLQSKNILKENTSVFYDQSNFQLPEDYHGLGYMNLFAMIFEIELKCKKFRRENEKLDNQIPADINLLFIEEPEAHMHPQMQHIFIKNISKILENEKKGLDSDGSRVSDRSQFNLQGIVTTHSSHITAESDFDTVKYFYKIASENKVICKNLKDLKNEYSKETNQYEFLKHYLTLNRAELFFADKAVLIEGDTERLLLPVMMVKLDNENKFDLPLLSQNISIIEVGAYSHIFEKFIDFIGVKYLIITDFDTCKKVKTGEFNKKNEPIFENKLCRVDDPEASGSLNNAIKHFLKGNSFSELKTSEENFYLKKNSLCIAFQHRENSYHAKSFEDAFINLNRKFISDNKSVFKGLKNIKHFDLKGDAIKDAYDLAEHCIDKKTHFALDIIYYSSAENYTTWEIPLYIKEGLLWLQK
ncbi:AAA family ATPase [Flavobacterium sp. YJ01]|uniref:ATP-dependent nuclease n=1 Tax=unclassified Flavobacterium TaxID=196869 RepID=UPI0023E403A5|nr:AAA family ATPase [Flavobacterium sp. YJ01]WET01921.1 AAA family ATPase [Flavobacterium sp. YJ01]